MAEDRSRGDGLAQFHGSPQNDHCFRVHPTGRNATQRDITVWRTDVDTILEAKTFCTNHRYVQMLPNGTTVYQCLGHDVSPEEKPTTPGIAAPGTQGKDAATPLEDHADSPAADPATVSGTEVVTPGTTGATLRGRHLIDFFCR